MNKIFRIPKIHKANKHTLLQTQPIHQDEEKVPTNVTNTKFCMFSNATYEQGSFVNCIYSNVYTSSSTIEAKECTIIGNNNNITGEGIVIYGDGNICNGVKILSFEKAVTPNMKIKNSCPFGGEEISLIGFLFVV